MNIFGFTYLPQESNTGTTFQEFIDIVQKIIEFESVTSEISPSCRLREDLSLDSLDIMNLIIEVSDRYNVIIDIDDLAANPTIGGLWNAINKTM